MDFEPPGLKDSIPLFNKCALSDLHMPVMFWVLETYTAVSKIVRHGVSIAQMESGEESGQEVGKQAQIITVVDLCCKDN